MLQPWFGADDPDQIALGAEIAHDTDDFDGEWFDSGVVKDCQSVALHADTNFVDRQDGRLLLLGIMRLAQRIKAACGYDQQGPCDPTAAEVQNVALHFESLIPKAVIDKHCARTDNQNTGRSSFGSARTIVR